jgi:23S rRNA pseudouridine955/2504/2580 synthase
VVARTRGAAQALTAAFRERTTKKTYWALVKGVPRTKEGKISTWLIKEATEDGDRMRIAKHGEQGADHAVSYYRVIDKAAQNLAWLEFEPYTGRTHQLRVHALHLGIRSSVTRNISSSTRTGNFPVGCRTGCTCWRGTSPFRTLMEAGFRSRRRCRRTWCRAGTCLVSMRRPVGSTRNEACAV